MADPGSLPSTVDGGERGATPEIQTATPGTMPFTPGSNVGHATVSAALSVVDAPAGTGTLPAQTPGTLANAAVTAMTPASVGATPMSGSNVVGLLPTMTPGTAMFSRTPFTGVGATPGGLIEEGRDAASSYQLYIGAQVCSRLVRSSGALCEHFKSAWLLFFGPNILFLSHKVSLFACCGGNAVLALHGAGRALSAVRAFLLVLCCAHSFYAVSGHNNPSTH